MYRIDVQSAAPALPAPAALGTPGYFTNGDPLAGTPATIVDADWANMVQETLMAPILAAGLAPSKSVYSQLLTAMRSVATASGASPGYLRVPFSDTQAIMMQWAALTFNSGQNVAYPIAFPNAALSLIPFLFNGVSVSGYTVNNKNGFTPTLSTSSAAGGYIVIGY